ncbi:sarcosine oxidase subunit delta [Rhizobium sp. SSA_523]|uniref:sarcosine oxidase subunit delta n=1 Tax=Rhizobium sp. SSA_523 TaxID=2952477 RepID=UPI002091544A|nr:sarcosine oxidase subunit delta [Rhizobium sp. SSA_523]MCO5732073.1 sarcosine oxidase subunit delta [Rhizobium sp. SSA_523]WKC22590.1 sarcosine oxidase subunit delta [Rhizobium sp. SSA_523]
MASLITCPHCGVRPREEFSIRGDAVPQRPAANAADEAWHAYVYLRDNPKGLIREFWHHGAGCRRFLVVERDNESHAVFRVVDAAEDARSRKGEAA